MAPSIAAMVLDSARRFGDAEAMVDGNRRWTYAGFGEATLESVRAAMAHGIAPGDRVGIWAPNSAEWVLAALGVLGAGGVLVPLNTRWQGEEVAYALDKADASVLFVAQGFVDADQIGGLRRAAPHLDALRQVITLEGHVDLAVPWDSYLQAAGPVDAAAAEQRIAGVGPDDVSDIMFTSGTTGRPKGAVLKHGPSLRAYVWLAELLTFRPGDRYLVVPPFFHCFGYKAGWMASLSQGVTVLPQRLFNVAEVLDRIQRERVSILLGPPTVFTDILNHPRRGDYDLSSLRVTTPSAAVVPVELVHRLRDELGFEVVITAYGLTESHALVSTCRPGDAAEDIARSVGRAVDGVELMIANDAGEPLPTGTAGEILVRGYVVMDGYWEDPHASAEAIDPRGWLHTGDIGVIDEAGFLSITDRKKDMIIVGGFNVYPAEVERVIMRQPEVAEAAVVGAADDRLGEVPVAFVVPRPGQVVDPDALVSNLGEQLAHFKLPRRVHVVDSLPRNASMKVLKNELRARLRS